MTRSRTLSHLLLLLAGLGTSVALACSCVPRTVEENFNNAATIFVGRILSAQEIRGDESELSAVAGTFRIIETIKGNPERLAVVETGFGGGDCGVPLLVGQSYVFFADPNGRINICNGTEGYTKGYEPDDALLQNLRELAKSVPKP